MPRKIVVTFEVMPGVDGARALRGLLKYAGRALGLRCTYVGKIDTVDCTMDVGGIPPM